MMYYVKKKNVSAFGVIFSVIAGLMIQAMFYNAFEINMEKLPIQFIVLVWIIFSAATYSFMKLVEI